MAPFKYISYTLKKIDKNCPFSMLGQFTIIICILGTLVIMILCSTFYYLKYRRAWGMDGNFMIFLAVRLKRLRLKINKKKQT